MGVFTSGRQNRFCAFCGHERRVYLKRHLSLLDVAGAAVLGTLLLAPFAGGFDPRGLGVGAIFVGFAELFTVLRYRVSLTCSRCGFDPILYRRSQEAAAKKVSAHLERRASDPRALLAGPVVPPLWKDKNGKVVRPRKPVDSSQQV